jgi:hypothetical protein
MDTSFEENVLQQGFALRPFLLEKALWDAQKFHRQPASEK